MHWAHWAEDWGAGGCTQGEDGGPGTSSRGAHDGHGLAGGQGEAEVLQDRVARPGGITAGEEQGLQGCGDMVPVPPSMGWLREPWGAGRGRWDSPEGDVVEADESAQGVGRDGGSPLQWHEGLQSQQLEDAGASAQPPHHLRGDSRSTSWSPDHTSLALRSPTTCREGGKCTPGAPNLNPRPQGVPGPLTPPTWPIRMEMLAKDLGCTRAEIELRQAAGYRGCHGSWGCPRALP